MQWFEQKKAESKQGAFALEGRRTDYGCVGAVSVVSLTNCRAVPLSG